MTLNDSNIPNFDKDKNWAGIRQKVHRRFYKQVSAAAVFVIMIISGVVMTESDDRSKLYSGTAFEKIVNMEIALEKELETLQNEVIEIKENARYFALIEQVNNINLRLDECRNQMNMNPLNPNYHRVYVGLLKSKRRALEILNEMKG